MASADASSSTPVSTIDMNLEVVTLPVSDVDRAKRFYQSLGWRLDADLPVGDDFRIVQFTPPHSGCSIHFGTGLTSSEPGAVDRMLLAVEDIEAARDDLVGRGVDVSEVYHYERKPGQTGETDVSRPGARPAEGALVLRVRVVQRPGWQRLAAPGDHDPAPRPGMGARHGRRLPG